MWKKIPERTKKVGAACVIYMVVLGMLFFVVRRKMYAWLIWNMLLAVMPLVISSFVVLVKKPAVRAGLLAVWMLFLPNAFYIATDLVHLSQEDFYDVGRAGIVEGYKEDIGAYTMLIVVFAGAVLGMLAGVMSVADVHGVMAKKKWAGWAIAGIVALAGFGVYIGRFVRLNSWDVLRPAKLIGEVVGSLDAFALQASVLFAIYIAAAYVLYTKVLKK